MVKATMTTTTALVLGLLLCSRIAIVHGSQQASVADEETRPTSYGVDCSFPVVQNASSTCGDLLGNRFALYENYMEGCRKYWGKKGDRCDATEKFRFDMSSRQPQSMVNYTAKGFTKIKAPMEIMVPLLRHWEQNKQKMEKEVFGAGNTFINYWDADVYMVDVYDDEKFKGAGAPLTRAVWDAARHVIEEWTGQEIRPISMWGIRVYTEGSILSPHVDRLPLVSSCIINVAQDVTAPWPLEVYGRDGQAVNVTMEPGDMVLYESHSLIHGRPFPLEGKYFANIFIHYEPTGRKLGDNNPDFMDELDDMIPPYIVRNSPQEEVYLEENPDGWKATLEIPTAYTAQETLTSQKSLKLLENAHQAALQGDMESLQHIADTNLPSLFEKDDNGWTPLHEAIRFGRLEVVKFLIERGASKNGRTTNGERPLALAHYFEQDEVAQYLKSLGAKKK